MSLTRYRGTELNGTTIFHHRETNDLGLEHFSSGLVASLFTEECAERAQRLVLEDLAPLTKNSLK